MKQTKAWHKEPIFKSLTFEELLEERYDRAPTWFKRIESIMNQHPSTKILANWRRFAPEFEEREEDFDWGDAHEEADPQV